MIDAEFREQGTSPSQQFLQIELCQNGQSIELTSNRMEVRKTIHVRSRPGTVCIITTFRPGDGFYFWTVLSDCFNNITTAVVRTTRLLI